MLEKKSTLLQKKQGVITGILRSLTAARINVDDDDFSVEEENQLQKLENVLDELLSQECPLCGEEMIFSIIGALLIINQGWNIAFQP